MNMTVTAQNVHQHKKNIRRGDLKGLTCFMQMACSVRVTASLDHQAIVRDVLGEPNSHEHHQLTSYWRWDDVDAVRLVDVLYAVATANVVKNYQHDAE
ncbi:hypothetical protein [Serratia marcescens]|uniref:hypothetical protein n=1 Tax=Serratia marcescens TaxID=615 RepID=UPI0011BA06A5|nr:hypothetical protein [Serratia marcescens]HED1412873.1 hypothetical protein [Klebsiella pneumoniae]EGT0505919.1 hypothetical protein [Serratia marcescens]MDP8632956.1 hypothetical protein [Serratia marcescens]MDP8751784.1 hypothetical protein [Serratia marcescens]MDP8766054.1 hypothetical protein [Serratia marcescens]